MVSPLTGGTVTLNWEWREIEFRKEKFIVMTPYYVCDDTKEQFTTTESDTVWMNQLHNQYCAKHGIPYTDEIIEIRKRYDLSAAKMSLILGFGENQWRRYEQGEIPSVSNGKLIRSIMRADLFLDLVDSSKESLTESEFSRIRSRVNAVVSGSANDPIEEYEIRRVYSCARSQENGFAQLSLTRLKNIMIYLIQNCGDIFCTKMNKLLFYTDFLSYRERGIAMTVDKSFFTQEELDILDSVCSRFHDMSSRDISEISHKEKAWIDCHDKHSRIPFSDAFALKAI